MKTAAINIDTEKQLIPKLRFKEFEGDWSKEKLGNNVEIKSGISPSAYDLKETGSIPFLKVEELNNCEKYQVESRFYAEEGRNLVPFGSIIFPKRGAAILNNKVRITAVDSYMDSNLMALMVNEENNCEFLFYFLLKEQLFKIADTSTIPQINNKHIEPYPCFIPTLPEQQKIASFLSAVDQKIQQLNNKKELLELYKKGVMQKLFSGELRFKDKNGNDYPDWEEKRLGEVCTNIAYGMNAPAKIYDGENKYLRITDIDESSNGLNTDKLTSPDGLLENKFRVTKGDILFARTGASVGKSYLYQPSDGVLYFAGFLIRFNVKEENPSFIYAQFQTSRYDKWVKVMSMRSGQPGINAEEYKSFKIDLPSLEEQQKIATFL